MPSTKRARMPAGNTLPGNGSSSVIGPGSAAEIGAAALDRADETFPLQEPVGLAVAHRLHALGGVVQYVVLDQYRRLVHLAGDDLQLAGALERIEALQGAVDRRPEGQQPV